MKERALRMPAQSEGARTMRSARHRLWAFRIVQNSGDIRGLSTWLRRGRSSACDVSFHAHLDANLGLLLLGHDDGWRAFSHDGILASHPPVEGPLQLSAEGEL